MATHQKKENRSQKTALPRRIRPMLCTLIDAPFDQKDWLFEVKWDGFRAIAYVNKGKVDLRSRNQISFNQRFSPLVTSLEKMPIRAVFDGEIVCLDAKGKSHFQYMQNYQRTGKGRLFYYIFDLLFYDGVDLRAFPLIERKAYLKKVLAKHPVSHVRFSTHVKAKGIAFFKKMVKGGLEGMIGKNGQSAYVSRRTRDWVKVKNIQEQEVVIGGFTEPRGSRQEFGALLVGVYAHGRLHYVGHVGGGFDEETLVLVYKKLKPLIQEKCPFVERPVPNMPVKWVRPKLVCEVKFTEWTASGSLRHPVFLGLRNDKSPRSVVRERAHHG